MDLFNELFTFLERSLLSLAREENHEFIAAVADGQVSTGTEFLQDMGQVDQGTVTRIVAVCIIDLFEMINVHHYEGNMMARQYIPGSLVLQIIKEKAAVMESCEFILEYQGGGVFSGIFQVMEKFLIICSIALHHYAAWQRTMTPGV